MSELQIPIANVYYLYCYAWNCFEERDVVRLDDLGELDAVLDLLGLVLCHGVERLIRQGIDRGYLDFREDLIGVRGKINIADTIKRALRPRGRISCEFQELSHNVIHNRILRSTLCNLVRLPSLHEKIIPKVRKLDQKLAGITSLSLHTGVFNQVQLDRNRQIYRMLLEVCFLIHKNLLIDENTGQHTFNELRNEKTMHKLFEKFVIEFYRRELKHYDVGGNKKIYWDHQGSLETELDKLPGMEADVILESTTHRRRIILDTKYYKKAMTSGPYVGEKKKLRSEHLYQLMAYVRNRQARRPNGPQYEGILLYPTVSYPVSVDLRLEGFSIKARSIDLAQRWQDIHQSMLDTIQCGVA